MASVGGSIELLDAPPDEQIGADLQIAAATFAPTEMTNSSEFGGVISIGPTFLPLSLR